MESNSNLYEILEIDKTASKEEIRTHYKRLAAKYHPDKKDQGNDKKFMEISDAYEILSDPDKKKIYDKYGIEGVNKQQYEQPQYEGDKKKCKNRIHFLHVNLEDIYLGSTINVEYSRKAFCKGCDGTGTDNPAARRKCPNCGGKGEKVVMQKMGIMLMQNAIDCDSCEGTGWEKNEFVCEDCNGDRVCYEKKNITVDLEKGSPDGYRFTFFGMGNQKPRVQDGDLIVEVVLKKHKFFRREGADIWYRLDLSLLEAMTGFKKLIPSLNGMERIEVGTEPGEVIQNGVVMVVEGKGLPFFNNPKRSGNLFVEFNIVFPSKVSEDKLIEVEKLLSERMHSKGKKEDKEDKEQDKEREVYYVSEFKPEEANLAVSGGKTEKDNFKYSYQEDEEDSYYHDQGQGFGGGQGVNCQHQ